MLFTRALRHARYADMLISRYFAMPRYIDIRRAILDAMHAAAAAADMVCCYARMMPARRYAIFICFFAFSRALLSDREYENRISLS